jgi:hypothetical protein
MAARGVLSMDQPVCEDNCPPELVGRGLGSCFKYNWFLGAGKQQERTRDTWRPGLGLKRNPMQDTAKNNKTQKWKWLASAKIQPEMDMETSKLKVIKTKTTTQDLAEQRTKTTGNGQKKGKFMSRCH